MAAPRPPYAPASALAQLPQAERLLLRLRRRRRKGWPVQALLDERAELLEVLRATEKRRAKFVTQVRERAVQKPAAHDLVEEMVREAQRVFDRTDEGVRHRLLVCDSVLSIRGVRPWEDEKPSTSHR